MKMMSVKKYLGIYAASLAILVIPPIFLFGIYIATEEMFEKDSPNWIAALTMGLAILCALQFVIVQLIFYFGLLVKMWKPLQDGHTPVTVPKAIFFSVIPLFRLYWVFIAWGSYPKEYNNFVRRHNLPVPEISGAVFYALPICIVFASLLLFTLVGIPFAMMGIIIKVCEANNALVAVRLGQFDAN